MHFQSISIITVEHIQHVSQIKTLSNFLIKTYLLVLNYNKFLNCTLPNSKHAFAGLIMLTKPGFSMLSYCIIIMNSVLKFWIELFLILKRNFDNVTILFQEKKHANVSHACIILNSVYYANLTANIEVSSVISVAFKTLWVCFTSVWNI